GHPWHPTAFGRERVTGPDLNLLLHEQLLARSLPLLPRHDLWCAHCGLFGRSDVSSSLVSPLFRLLHKKAPSSRSTLLLVRSSGLTGLRQRSSTCLHPIITPIDADEEQNAVALARERHCRR